MCFWIRYGNGSIPLSVVTSTMSTCSLLPSEATRVTPFQTRSRRVPDTAEQFATKSTCTVATLLRGPPCRRRSRIVRPRAPDRFIHPSTHSFIPPSLSLEGVSQMVYILPERLLELVRPAFDFVLRRIQSLKRCVQACGCKIETTWICAANWLQVAFQAMKALPKEPFFRGPLFLGPLVFFFFGFF